RRSAGRRGVFGGGVGDHVRPADGRSRRRAGVDHRYGTAAGQGGARRRRLGGVPRRARRAARGGLPGARGRDDVVPVPPRVRRRPNAATHAVTRPQPWGDRPNGTRSPTFSPSLARAIPAAPCTAGWSATLR